MAAPPIFDASLVRPQDSDRADHATNGASVNHPSQATGSKRPLEDASRGDGQSQAAKRIRDDDSGENIDAEALAYMTSSKPFPEAYQNTQSGGFVIKRTPNGELVQVSPRDAPLDAFTYNGRCSMMRQAVALAYDEHRKDDETSRIHKAFIDTQSTFRPTYYTWDELTVTFDQAGTIVDLNVRSPLSNNSNFIVRPSVFYPGTVCKIIARSPEGIRTRWEMCAALSQWTGATHAFVETYRKATPVAFLGKKRVCLIVSILPDQSAHNAHKQAKARTTADFISIDKLDIKRNADGQINNLLPKNPAHTSVNFMSINPDRPGYVVKYDSTPKGIHTRNKALSRLAKENGCTQLVGPVVPVPGQTVDNATEFQFVQTVTLAQTKIIGGVRQKADQT